MEEIGNIFLSRSSDNLLSASLHVISPLTHEKCTSLEGLLYEIFWETWGVTPLQSSLNFLFFLCFLFFSLLQSSLTSRPRSLIPITDGIPHSLKLLEFPVLGGHLLGCITNMTKEVLLSFAGSTLFFISQMWAGCSPNDHLLDLPPLSIFSSSSLDRVKWSVYLLSKYNQFSFLIHPKIVMNDSHGVSHEATQSESVTVHRITL